MSLLGPRTAATQGKDLYVPGPLPLLHGAPRAELLLASQQAFPPPSCSHTAPGAPSPWL